jgi:hypothetical protein
MTVEPNMVTVVPTAADDTGITMFGVHRMVNGEDEIVAMYCGTDFIWPDPWTDIWDEGVPVIWENVWRDKWSAQFAPPSGERIATDGSE